MKTKNINIILFHFMTTLILLPLVASAYEEADWNYHFLTANESITFRIDKFYLQDHFRSVCYIADESEQEYIGNTEMHIDTLDYCPRKEFYDYVYPATKPLKHGDTYYFGENGIIDKRDKDYMYVTFTVIPTKNNIHPFIGIKCQN